MTPKDRNRERAEAGMALVQAHVEHCGPDEYGPEETDAMIIDSLANILHAARAAKLNPLQLLRVATSHFNAEETEANQ
mgnify:CR=1 FL=1